VKSKNKNCKQRQQCNHPQKREKRVQHQSKRRETGKVKSKFVLTKREVVKREGF